MMSDDAVNALRKHGASESEINDFSSSIIYDRILNEEELISVFESERKRILARRSGIPALQPDDEAIPRRPSHECGPDAQTLLRRFLARFG
jgi:hypothetical protein